MAKEIERKFLVKDTSYRKGSKKVVCRQGYICHDPETVVRVRVYGESGYLTIKSKAVSITRDEYEYEIPVSDANEMLDKLCKMNKIEKFRYECNYNGSEWIIDEFMGANEGLTIAEIELASEQESFEKPLWLGDEITGDYKYAGTNLSIKPYTTW